MLCFCSLCPNLKKSSNIWDQFIECIKQVMCNFSFEDDRRLAIKNVFDCVQAARSRDQNIRIPLSNSKILKHLGGPIDQLIQHVFA